MPATRNRLDVELALLAAEVDYRAQLIAAGVIPADARRNPTPVELRAGVRFAALERIVDDATASIVRRTEAIRTHVLDQLAGALAPAMADASPYDALALLDRLADPTRPDSLPGVRDVVDQVAAAIKADLEQTARAGTAEALDEARRQGIPDHVLPTVDPVTAAVEQAAAAQAQRVASAPVTRLLGAASRAAANAARLPDATGTGILVAALDAAEATDRAGVTDLARQSANITHGLGRTAALAAFPPVREVYASELLDANTCGPCATVDGRTYDSLESALADYPGAGGYVRCDGGARCRGTLVLIHATESGPELDNPGHGGPAPGGPADRTPRGPLNPPEPPPSLAPDAGVADPSTVDRLTVDDNGYTTVPVDQLEPPIGDTVDLAARPDLTDPAREFGDWSELELEALLSDATAPIERQLAAADELDARAQGLTRQTEADLTPDELAQLEEDRAAWEAAGGYAADAALAIPSTTGGGRLIDRVRALWTEELEQETIRAEAATNGAFLRKDRLAEFRAKYGNTEAVVLFEGPARVAYYYASEELRLYWETTTRKTFAEFAVDHGAGNAKMVARARAAEGARKDAALRAEESDAGRAKRARAKALDRAKRGPLTEGERLARDQRRRDRIRAAERRAQAQNPTPPDGTTQP